ncbi:M20/M25/M40 family metallo-hydrolase [Methanomicrobium antiquum]|uniref:M20/M25/M40 family metallo-hydrolase n=1 Tax=Methanomicrobium antiquum TaxID=487686 RepID=A0AAF0FSJ3_9EURY|nr:M20/M25/M40 family metallo-hydrolase [Methanomicrobium antiquum]WFN37832.1 M20/M25/M40 family metallo-hydrolase [Methanomicrobium antiquum]
MNVSKICSELVRLKSENPPGITKGTAQYIGDILKSLDISFKFTDDGNGRCNIYTDYPDKPLLLMGHLDVVPVLNDGWDKDPFSGEISSGYVYGRGSTDMKGGCAALISAVYQHLKNSYELPCNLCFVCDEENGGNAGIKHLLSKNVYKPCDCIIAEPTPYLNPAIGQKGLLRADIEVKGEPAHGSLYPAVGVSAVMKSVDLLHFIQRMHEREYVNDKKLDEIIKKSSSVLAEIFNIQNPEKVLRRITFNPGKICGGEEINIVAQKCRVNLEMRIPWGCSAYDIFDEISKKESSAEIKPLEICNPGLTEPNEKIVKTACRNIKKVYKKDSFPILQWAASDARYLREKSFRVIEYGPGDLKTIHGINEKVSIKNLNKSVEIYAGILKDYDS